MEALLSLSFDNLSSRDISRIRKGLRQIEGLVAQICLAEERSTKAKRARIAAKDTTNESLAACSLSEVAADPAFREFFRLQDGFEGNGQ